MGFLFTVFYQPTANALFFLMDMTSVSNIAVGILIFVIVVKILLLKTTIQNTKVQVKLNAIADDLKKVRENVKDKQEQMEKTLELYKKAEVNPFTPILSLLIQIPIFVSIFFVIKGVGENTIPYETVFYDFVTKPEILDFQFLSINITDQGGILIALLVGVSQIFTMYYSQKTMPQKAVKKIQKRLFLLGIPLLVMVFSYVMVVAVGVYWFFNNIITILQEILVMQKIRKQAQESGDAENPQG